MKSFYYILHGQLLLQIFSTRKISKGLPSDHSSRIRTTILGGKQNDYLIIFISSHLSTSQEVDILRGKKIHRKNNIQQWETSRAAI